VPIKPPDDPDGLTAPARTRAADRLARLEADKELVSRLERDGYKGESWRRFAHALAEYGIQVMRAWIRTGEIFRQCKRKRIGGQLSSWRARDEDDALEIACEIVALALNAFRDKVLARAKWDPTRGANLKTFFIGQCVYQFPRVYCQWLDEEQVVERMNARDLRDAVAPPPSLSIPTLVALRRELEALETLPLNDERNLEILREMGFGHAEIAEIICVSKRSIESKLYRHKRRRDRQTPDKEER
jgi:DNA-directed RNA polymerase specialized sigma24 family protein